MSFLSPNKPGFVIYTKNKCPYCELVKQLIIKNNCSFEIIQSDEYLKEKELFLQFIGTFTKKKHTTFPMVFLNGSFIGGYNDTQVYFTNINNLEF